MNSWHKHKIFCTSIATFEKKHNRNILQDKSFPTHLSPKEIAKMAKIVGKKCLMQCELSGVPASVLLDTGAQVSIVEKYLLENLINAEIKAISETLGGHDSLRMQWGNNSKIPFAGFAILQLQVGDGKVGSKVDVPFLEATDHLQHPIVGFNVVKVKVIAESQPECSLIKIFQSVIDIEDEEKLKAFVGTLTVEEEDSDNTVEIRANSITIPAGKLVQIPCKADISVIEKRTPMSFQQHEIQLPKGIDCIDSVAALKKGARNYFKIPVSNSATHDITLKKNTVVGRLEYVASTSSFNTELSSEHQNAINQVTVKSPSEQYHTKPQSHGYHNIQQVKDTVHCESLQEHQQNVINSIALSGHQTYERAQARQLLTEFSDVFSADENDIGNVKDFK